MSPIAQALYFATVMHASGVIAGWHYHKWLHRAPRPLSPIEQAISQSQEQVAGLVCDVCKSSEGVRRYALTIGGQALGVQPLLCVEHGDRFTFRVGVMLRTLADAEPFVVRDPDVRAALAVRTSVDTIESALLACKHRYQADDYCITCGARRFGETWVAPHWRDLLVGAHNVVVGHLDTLGGKPRCQ